MSPQETPEQQEFDALKVVADDPEALKARIDGLATEVALAIYKIAIDAFDVDDLMEPEEPEESPDAATAEVTIVMDRIHAILECLIMRDDVAELAESL